MLAVDARQQAPIAELSRRAVRLRRPRREAPAEHEPLALEPRGRRRRPPTPRARAATQSAPRVNGPRPPRGPAPRRAPLRRARAAVRRGDGGSSSRRRARSRAPRSCARVSTANASGDPGRTLAARPVARELLEPLGPRLLDRRRDRDRAARRAARRRRAARASPRRRRARWPRVERAEVSLVLGERAA